MSLLQTAAILGSIAATTYAHGHVSGVVVAGEYYQGYDPSFQYMQTIPKVVGWSTPQDLGNGFIAPDAYSTPDIICHLAATPAQKAAKVAAGGTVEIEWTAWPESHHGPVIDYLAKCANDDCSTVTKADLEFFKIGASGLINDDPVPGTWATDKLIANNNTWVATIPKDIAPGQYVLRNEIIALHSAGTADGAQNYPMCVNIEVTGSGTATPAGVKGTALYKENDAGIVVNIYAALDSYTIPGPPLYSGAASGSASSSAAAPVASSTKATSAPASTKASSSPASSAPASSAPATSAAATTSASAVAPVATTTAAPSPSTAGNVAATETDTCTSTVTVSTSVTAAAATATPSVYTAAVNTANAAVSALASAIPSSALTATISTALPSPAAYGSSQASASAAAGMPSKPLPEGFTLKDLLEWVSYLLGKAINEGGVHARDLVRRR